MNEQRMPPAIDPSASASLHRRTGSTLIEVVAALLIIGGVATGMLTAQARSLERLRTSQWELTAQHVARELIVTWRLGADDVTVPMHGPVSDRENWSWERTVQELRPADEHAVTLVTLTVIYRSPPSPTSRWSRSYQWLVSDEP